jgi:hypothetical protein
MGNVLTAALVENRTAVEAAIQAKSDWELAARHFDTFFGRMANPSDHLWSEKMMATLRPTYYQARDADKECASITDRTVKAMPAALGNDTKKIFLQIASTCRIFHASHKVNFEATEIPTAFPEVPMVAAKKKGSFTYSDDLPTLYPKISLTFDYWVPKVLDWAQEIREQKFSEWKGEASFQHESCTDFMRQALLFLSDPASQLPICKQDMRQALLEQVFGTEFKWLKKSAKREDILANNRELARHLTQAGKEAGLTVPLESWNRIFEIKAVKAALSAS